MSTVLKQAAEPFLIPCVVTFCGTALTARTTSQIGFSSTSGIAESVRMAYL